MGEVIDFTKARAFQQYLKARKLFLFNDSYNYRRFFAKINLATCQGLEAAYPDFREAYARLEGTDPIYDEARLRDTVEQVKRR